MLAGLPLPDALDGDGVDGECIPRVLGRGCPGSRLVQTEGSHHRSQGPQVCVEEVVTLPSVPFQLGDWDGSPRPRRQSIGGALQHPDRLLKGSQFRVNGEGGRLAPSTPLALAGGLAGGAVLSAVLRAARAAALPLP